MDPSNSERQNLSEEPRFLAFPHLSDNATDADGKQRLNKYSSTITKDHDFPGAQVGRFSFSIRASSVWNRTNTDPMQAMLYAAGVPNKEAMKNSPHVGVASVWWEGNPCKYELSLVPQLSFC